MNIAQLRKNAGLSQEELAARLQIRQTTVSMWETGRTLPRAGILIQLAKLFDCTVDDLLRKENE